MTDSAADRTDEHRLHGRRRFLTGAATLAGAGLFLPTVLASTTPARAAPTAARTPQWRPAVHFTPARNWMNDPNGLVFHDGEYHLFFQHNPDSSEHANLSWGHAVSTDLVRWDELDVALEPDELGEIYSGSAVVDHGNTSGFFDGVEPGLVAFYTSAGETQQQSIAYSQDRGRTWTKFEGNPVIGNPGIEDFRDPKVIRHEPSGQWVLLLAVDDHIAFYRSPNLRDWELVSEFGADRGAHGGVWECPDLFELPVTGTEQSRWVLVVSINPGGPAGGSATQYFLGDFDGTTFLPHDEPDTVLWAELGADFYAAQSWSDMPAADGRRLWIGWLSNWDYTKQVPTEPWRGAMTVPREVGLVDTDQGPRLTQQPVRELESARGPARRWSGTVSDEDAGVEFAGAALDVVAEFSADSAASFGFDVFVGERSRTRVGYDTRAGELFVDRTESGSADPGSGYRARHAAPLDTEDGVVRLRLLIDHSTVEVFAADGRVVLTDLVLRDEGDTLRPFAEDGRVRLNAHIKKIA